ncbi:MAG: hypothetical protein ACR5K9_05710 [Wolbachia sp.]
MNLLVCGQPLDNLTEILKGGRDKTFPDTGFKLIGKPILSAYRMFDQKLDYKLVTESKKFALIAKRVAKQFKIAKGKASKIVKEYYDFSGVADYSSFRVMHGVIENTLSCLTGLSKHELDEKRCSNLEGLVEEVKAALDNNCDLKTYVKNQGVKGDKLKQDLAQHMQSVIDALKNNENSDLFTRLVRNWNQDKKLHILMPSEGLEDVPKKLVDLLSESNYAVVRDYLEYHEVEESKIDELCQLGKEVCAERKEFVNSLGGSKKQAGSTPLGKNEKKLLEELGKALGMKLKDRDKLTYRFFSNFIASQFSYNSEYEYNEGKYPLKKLRDFCDKNKYKVKLKNLDDLSAEDLKSKLCDYIGCQPLEQLEERLDSLRGQSSSNSSSDKEAKDNFDTFVKLLISNNDESIKSRIQQFKRGSLQGRLAKAIGRLPEKKLEDLRKDLSEEENDYNALCRMGLVGNDINPTKVQGYNDINLQHVAMLIDPVSTDLNKPAQLIQAPRRLRCLNPNRHSAFFCYSNGKLSFDINLLKEGDYISAYNKSVAKLSNRRACGDKLATEIIDYINRKIKGLKRIDDLAGQSIEIALNSFIEVYNANQHDFNRSKKEFIGVLKHARNKLSSYEKELRGNGGTLGMEILEMLVKALIMVGYLISRFTYYLATKGNYNSFLKKVDELRNDPKVATYAHIIAEYSVKDVMEIGLLMGKFVEIYQQREKPRDETDAKSLNNYLEHINACLKHPVYLKLFDKITSPLMKGDYLLKLLDQLYPEENNQDKVEKLRTFRKNLKDLSFKFTKDDLSNIEQVQFYLVNILGRINAFNNYYYNQENCNASIIPRELLEYRIDGVGTKGSKSTHKDFYLGFQGARALSACKNDLSELNILSQRENIKLAKETADYVISPLLSGYSKAAKRKQGSEEDKAVINNIVTVAGQVKNDLEKSVEPFTTQDILSPSTKFINPIINLFMGKKYEDGRFSFVYRG